MNVLKTWRVALVVILFSAALSITAAAYRGASPPTSSDVTGAQDTANLERRISLLEQRFYSIETSINRLERQAALVQPPSRPQSSSSDLEVNLLRGEIGMLQRRLGEIECGLIKLDERTAAPATREARRRANPNSTDPCRLNAESPVQLSTRP
jgi:hypothetical protein